MEKVGQNSKNSNLRARNSVLKTITEHGKLQPQAIDLEQAVLGAMMLEKNAVTDAIDILNESSFYDIKHATIFEAMHKLIALSQPIDLLTVINKLKKEGELEKAGGVVYISQLTNRIASAAHVAYYSRIITQKFVQRELIRISTLIFNDAFEETTDVFELLNKAELELFKISQNNMKKNVDTMKNIVPLAIEEIQNASQNSDGISGVPTGFRELDKITAGWQRSDMIVLAARPGMGKTAFVLSMARNSAIDYGMPVAIFSLEMSSVQLVKRLISSETKIDADKLRKGNLTEADWVQLNVRINKLSTAPIFIDDTAGISVFDLRTKCRRLKLEHNIEIIIIDYLQLMSSGEKNSGNSGNRVQEISTISRSIKEIAKELNVPIIALSQLSRSVELRGGDKRPMLSDLRESGAIEQDADIVSFIYRPEYYQINQNEEGESNLGVGEIIIAKHRNGSLGTVRLKFIGQYARFENFETFGDDFIPMQSNNLPMNENFDHSSNSYTVQSKMNQSEDDFSVETEDAPF
jgi:replicative DNA helicase